MIRALLLLLPAAIAAAAPLYGPVETVQAGGAPLQALGYSVPAWCDWNGDNLPDLLVGEGGGAFPNSRIRLYLNQGAPGAPLFGACTYLQAGGGDLISPGSG
jgi:hypothetical protein